LTVAYVGLDAQRPTDVEVEQPSRVALGEQDRKPRDDHRKAGRRAWCASEPTTWRCCRDSSRSCSPTPSRSPPAVPRPAPAVAGSRRPATWPDLHERQPASNRFQAPSDHCYTAFPAVAAAQAGLAAGRAWHRVRPDLERAANAGQKRLGTDFDRRPVTVPLPGRWQLPDMPMSGRPVFRVMRVICRRRDPVDANSAHME
jgi:hypothetical protein